MFSKQLPRVCMLVRGRRGGGSVACSVCVVGGGHSREERFHEHLRAQIQFVIEWISIFFLSFTPFLTVCSVHTEWARLPLAAEVGNFQRSYHCRGSPLACIVRGKRRTWTCPTSAHSNTLPLLSRSLQNLPGIVPFRKQHLVIKSSC